MLWICSGINNGQVVKMFDRIIYEFLYWINGVSTKITSWSWCMLYSDRRKGYGNRRRQKNSEDLKKSE